MNEEELIKSRINKKTRLKDRIGAALACLRGDTVIFNAIFHDGIGGQLIKVPKVMIYLRDTHNVRICTGHDPESDKVVKEIVREKQQAVIMEGWQQTKH